MGKRSSESTFATTPSFLVLPIPPHPPTPLLPETQKIAENEAIKFTKSYQGIVTSHALSNLMSNPPPQTPQQRPIPANHLYKNLNPEFLSVMSFCHCISGRSNGTMVLS
jgi:hypothetical protein